MLVLFSFALVAKNFGSTPDVFNVLNKSTWLDNICTIFSTDPQMQKSPLSVILVIKHSF